MRKKVTAKACDFCKRWGQTCLRLPWGRYGFKTTHPRCLNVDGLRVFRTGTKPSDDVTILSMCGPRLTNYIIKENVHPAWKNRRKTFLRNNVRQKRKDRHYTR